MVGHALVLSEPEPSYTRSLLHLPACVLPPYPLDSSAVEEPGDTRRLDELRFAEMALSSHVFYQVKSLEN